MKSIDGCMITSKEDVLCTKMGEWRNKKGMLTVEMKKSRSKV
jgi:hypothetical protein